GPGHRLERVQAGVRDDGVAAAEALGERFPVDEVRLRHSDAVAALVEQELHLLGRADDGAHPGVPLQQLQREVAAEEAGGAGDGDRPSFVIRSRSSSARGRSSQPTWVGRSRWVPTRASPSSTYRKPLCVGGTTWSTLAPGSSRMSTSVTGTRLRVDEVSVPVDPLYRR